MVKQYHAKQILTYSLHNMKNIPLSSFVHPSVRIECEKFSIGENSYIGPGCVITCKEFTAGDYLYFSSNVEVGRGGCTGPNSIVNIGNHVGVFENTIINPSDRVTIGNDVGIGCECLLWTHGAWLDVLQGFPADFGPIVIGNNVWLPARSIMLPNTSIGDNCVIGTGSTITKNIPAGSLAAGTPCKVLRENYYPKLLTKQQKQLIIEQIVREWFDDLVPHKNITSVVGVEVYSDLVVAIIQKEYSTFINVDKREIQGKVDYVVEDLRDFMRRKGIKIYTGKPFKSIGAYYQAV